MYGSSAFWMSFLLGAAISVICFLIMNPLLRLLGSTETILPYARQYGFWIFLSGPFLTTSCTINNHLRYEGKAFYAMIGLTAGGILNIIGDPILMFGLGLGVSGAGLSTCISQIVSFLILLHMVMSGRTVVHYHPSLTARSPQVYWNIAKMGSPSLSRQLLSALSTVFLNRAAMVYGDAAIAAMSIVGRVSFLIAAVAIGIGQGMQPVASFNYGARKYDRVRASWLFTEIVGTIFLTALGIITFLFADPIVGWFRNDPEVIKIGSAALRWASISCVLQQTTVSANMLLQSTGQSKSALLLASLRSGIFFIPLILILPVFFGVHGIEAAQPAADILSAVVSFPFAVPFLHSMGKNPEKEKI
jgi:putative MATE family efflux protein